MKEFENYYGYEDVFIIPKYSEILTRSDVDTSVLFYSKNSELSFKLDVPVMSSNMDTVTECELASVLRANGAIGALHRFMSIEENTEQFQKVKSSKNEMNTKCFVSIGVNKDYRERAKALYDSGARLFIVDIAHGHSKMMKDVLKWLKKEEFGKNIFVIAGNVTTPEAVKDLENWGADAIKVGIGPGFVCTTKDVTGVTMPIFTAVQKCASVSNVPIIADGGCRAYGDIAKAIGVGASAVMSGYFFAGCDEVPLAAKVFDSNGNEQFIYRGMASADAMKKVRTENVPTPEGRSTAVKPRGSAAKVVLDIQGGLRSAYSYVGARNNEEFFKNVVFGLRRRNMNS